MASADFTVFHNINANRFEVNLPGDPAILVYRLRSGMMILMHTEVPPDFEGRGIAAILAKAALDYAKDNHFTVKSFCSYTTRYIERHKEYHDLLNG